MKDRIFNVDFARAAAITAAMILLSACSSEDKVVCDDVQEYERSKSLEPLAIGEELDEPDRQGQLTIPPVPDDADLLAGNPCLDRPPDYFSE